MTITHGSQSHDATVSDFAAVDILEALDDLVQLNTDELDDTCDNILIRYLDEETFARYEPQLAANFGELAHLLYDCALEKIRFIRRQRTTEVLTVTMAPDEYEPWCQAMNLSDTPASRAKWAAARIHQQPLPVRAA